MPFHSLFDAEYERVIRPAIEAVGLTCERGDEIYSPSPIIQNVWGRIRRARVVVAELSGRNPNVMYEVGLAHAIGKPILLLTRNEEDVPVDLRGLRYICYQEANPYWGADLRSDLTRVLRVVMDNPPSSPHLDNIRVETTLPEAPIEPLRQPEMSRCDLRELPDFPLKVAPSRNPLYDALLRLTTCGLEVTNVSNSLRRIGICL